jgi:hypothetical protein
MSRQPTRRQPHCWRPDLSTVPRTAQQNLEIAAELVAHNNRRTLIAIALWARRKRATVDEVKELVAMLGLIEAAG